MPTKDGTGPMGQGSKTGRGFGNCQGATNPDKEIISNQDQLTSSNGFGRCGQRRRCRW